MNSFIESVARHYGLTVQEFNDLIAGDKDKRNRFIRDYFNNPNGWVILT